MEKRLQHKARWVLAGWILFLAIVFLHPLFLDACGQGHSPNCPVCAHFSIESAIVVSFCITHFLVLIGHSQAVFQPKLVSRFFFVSPGRSPPALF